MGKKAEDQPTEEIQVSQDTEAPASTEAIVDDLKMPKHEGGRWTRLKAFIRTHHTRLIIAAGILIVVPTAVWAYLQFTKPIEAVSQTVNVPKAKAKTKASPLSG